MTAEWPWSCNLGFSWVMYALKILWDTLPKSSLQIGNCIPTNYHWLIIIYQKGEFIGLLIETSWLYEIKGNKLRLANISNFTARFRGNCESWEHYERLSQFDWPHRIVKNSVDHLTFYIKCQFNHTSALYDSANHSKW